MNEVEKNIPNSGIDPLNSNQLVNNLSLEKDPSEKKEAIYLSYILGQSLKRKIEEGDINIDIKSYLERKEIIQFCDLAKGDNNDLRLRNDALMNICKNTNERCQEDLRPTSTPTPKEVKSFLRLIKSECILPFGSELRDLIGHSVNKTYSEVLREVYSIKNNILERQKEISALRYIINDQELDNEIQNYLNGIRHEFAFQEILTEGSFHEITNIFPDIEDTNKEEDLKGKDVKLSVRVLKNAKGEYEYPSHIDEEKNCETAEVYVDVKATEKAEENARFKQNDYYKDKQNERGSRPLIIWSHVYNQDFKLIKDPYGNLKLQRDSSCYLSIEILNIMTELEIGRNDFNQRITYFDNNANEIIPQNLEERYKILKKEILAHINSGYCTFLNKNKQK